MKHKVMIGDIPCWWKEFGPAKCKSRFDTPQKILSQVWPGGQLGGRGLYSNN